MVTGVGGTAGIGGTTSTDGGDGGNTTLTFSGTTYIAGGGLGGPTCP